METAANKDVDGNLKGLILPFIATAALSIEHAPVTNVMKIANSGRSGFIAT